MTGIWPADLPRPMQRPYQAQRADPRQERTTEKGPPAYRRLYSAVPKSVGLTIDVTRSQKAVFDQFHDEVSRHGVLPFWMDDPTTDGWALLGSDGAPIRTDDGSPILLAARWLCLFGTETPIETIIGVRFQIVFSVTVMP